MKKKDDWYVLYHGDNVRIAWSSYRDWVNCGGWVKAWFFSIRFRDQSFLVHDGWQVSYETITQVCVLGLNIAVKKSKWYFSDEI